MSCAKPPKEGCLDALADNYNWESENSCCCVYSALITFDSDTLNRNYYVYKIDGKFVDVSYKYYIGKIDSPLVTYQILNRSDTTLFIENVVKLYPGKISNIKF